MNHFEEVNLSSIYKRRKGDRDIFQELMPSKVKEILLVATLYDSYTIVREGQFSDKIFGEYLQLNLYSAPRFTSVNSQEEALSILNTKHFDMVIIMAGVDKQMPLQTAEAIHEMKARLPILLLVNNNSDLAYFTRAAEPINAIDRVFVWNGNSTVFLAMIKYIEDKKNVARDTKLGNVRVILLVEDSVKYYSRYLPLLITSVMTQTQNLVSDESNDELHMILKMRARPKVLLVSTYEDAVDVIKKYKDYLLCVISDVKFAKEGIEDEDAGVELLKYVKQVLRFPVPLLMQSHDNSNAERAQMVGADFINKNSESLSMDIHNFIFKKLGFGDFVFRNVYGQPIDQARSLNEFEDLIRRVPIETLLFHGKTNDFSTWLMARGEINMAEQLLPYQVDDFSDPQDVRKLCLRVFERVKEKKLRGRIIKFDPSVITGDRFIVRLGKGSLGGKGRGLAFLSNFIENIDFKKIIPNINVRIPATSIIGSLEFDRFIEINDLYEKLYHDRSFENVKRLFCEAQLSLELETKLFQYLERMDKPLAVRSSGLFEDSLLQPFAGVYSTYILPNNHEDLNERFKQLVAAVKLVYASIFTKYSQSYFDAVNYKVEEEKMAVIIQELVGQQYENYYYPNLSGVAQSFNYYPFSYMKPDDGFSVSAVGLGMYVVGGEKSYRFCPKYPELNHSSLGDQIRDSQKAFYALDLSKKELDLLEGGEQASIVKMRIREAEKHGSLDHCTSTYDMENDMLIPGLSIKGPRVIDFADILKYNYVPLAETIFLLLKIFKQAMGTPVEIEYAVDLTKDERGYPTFYLLQIKPLIRREEEVEIDIDDFSREEMIMMSHKGMGNGELTGIRDVVYVDIDEFDRTRTKEMASQIGELNRKMEEEGREYILIGPGRWGTRDPFTGIPVLWAQISKAKVIVEMGLKDFPLDASLGSHFFHNVTSMNVGYYSIPFQNQDNFVRLNYLAKEQMISETQFIKHVRYDEDIRVFMDGREQTAVILLPENNKE
ncbi:pyruvate, phosphate dikinase [Puteibacter caeruleilacunae]|nr:pyruvate, phosphate dikinase [Puteibacter caeruleilacunae]